MTHTDMEKRLQRAVVLTTPDVFDSILKARTSMQKPAPQSESADHAAENIVSFMPKPRPAFGLRRVLAMAAALVIMSTGAVAYYTNYIPYALLAVDVNPSFELSLNRYERVLNVNARNDEAMQVLGDMKLKGISADIAVNALVGSMVKHGYINYARNSILISVDSHNADIGEDLRERAMSAATQSLQGYGAVISQLYHGDAELKRLSREYNTSEGKAELIRQLIALNPALTFNELSALSIHELNLIAASKMLPPENMVFSGHVNGSDYIGSGRAIEIALEALNATRDQFSDIVCEIDYEYGRIVYEVELDTDEHEYEYSIDAITGEILEHESEWRHPDLIGWVD